MDSLMKEKYKYVKNMLSQDLVNFLTSFSLKNIKGHHLHPIMESETSLQLKPTYSYNRIYYAGSELKKHKDRNVCEISASIGLNFYYKNPNYEWPLCLNNIPIVTQPGDGVIYKGNEVEHWRPIFNQPEDSWHHQLFIHYVNLNGPYADLEADSEE
jgi:hypothetical protein